MATLLHLDSSPLASSVSRELTREFVTNWKIAHPSGRVIDRDLAANPPKPLDQAWIHAAYTPAETRQPEHKAALAYSEECINELEQADEYVFGVAMHNFSIPSVFKLWIDQVVRAGRTFSYGGAKGPEGLLTGKKATILVATGGVYQAGSPIASLTHRSLPAHHLRISRHNGCDLRHRRRDVATHVRHGRSQPLSATPPRAG